jgi:hypothetical protein
VQQQQSVELQVHQSICMPALSQALQSKPMGVWLVVTAKLLQNLALKYFMAPHCNLLELNSSHTARVAC